MKSIFTERPLFLLAEVEVQMAKVFFSRDLFTRLLSMNFTSMYSIIQPKSYPAI